MESKSKESLPMFKDVFSKDENWRTLFSRLPGAGLVNLKDEDYNKIMNLK